MNKLIPMLLKFDGYPPGVVVALLLHGILMYIFMPKEFDPADQIKIQPIAYVVASAVKQSPQQMRRLNQLETQRRNEETERNRQREREQQRQRDAEAQRQQQAEAERQRVAEVNRQREAAQERERQADAEKQRQAEAERQRQVAAEQQRRAADAERARQAADNAQNQSVENQLVAQYMTIIRDLISSNGSRPANARNGMVAVVQIRLAPTGEVISRRIVQSSGSDTFDRAIEQAVDRVGTFSELQDMPNPLFERYFRTFNVEYKPEDLLR
jgi:colicin import membrane protein